MFGKNGQHAPQLVIGQHVYLNGLTFAKARSLHMIRDAIGAAALNVKPMNTVALFWLVSTQQQGRDYGGV